MTGPRTVALGGGHGLAAALRALTKISDDVTAVVSVADDGGSSGRLVREMGIPAPGDARRCLLALSGESEIGDVFAYRFGTGELAGHALGNLILAALADMTGSLGEALAAASHMLGARGSVIPAVDGHVRLVADVGGVEVTGQSVLTGTPGIRRIRLDPPTPPANPHALAAVQAADLVVVGPGSLFTSLLPVLCVPEIREALAASHVPIVFIANLTVQSGETTGMDIVDHVRVLLDHVGPGIVNRIVVNDGPVDRGTPLVPPEAESLMGIPVVRGTLASEHTAVHDPEALAATLKAFV